MVQTIQSELERLFAEQATWFAETKRERGLEICVVEVRGFSAWNTEAAAVEDLESRMESDCWDWLNGYRLLVIEKEDAGACRWKKGGDPDELDRASV